MEGRNEVWDGRRGMEEARVALWEGSKGMDGMQEAWLGFRGLEVAAAVVKGDSGWPSFFSESRTSWTVILDMTMAVMSFSTFDTSAESCELPSLPAPPIAPGPIGGDPGVAYFEIVSKLNL